MVSVTPLLLDLTSAEGSVLTQRMVRSVAGDSSRVCWRSKCQEAGDSRE